MYSKWETWNKKHFGGFGTILFLINIVMAVFMVQGSYEKYQCIWLVNFVVITVMSGVCCYNDPKEVSEGCKWPLYLVLDVLLTAVNAFMLGAQNIGTVLIELQYLYLYWYMLCAIEQIVVNKKNKKHFKYLWIVAVVIIVSEAVFTACVI